MPDIKEVLISPFSLVPSSSPPPQSRKKEQRAFPFQLCKCDSDEENDYGMAPECVFYCKSSHTESRESRNAATKKRKHAAARHVKKTRKHATS